jgi:hypothetical protein
VHDLGRQPAGDDLAEPAVGGRWHAGYAGDVYGRWRGGAASRFGTMIRRRK